MPAITDLSGMWRAFSGDRRRIDARGCADYAAIGGHRSQGPYQPCWKLPCRSVRATNQLMTAVPHFQFPLSAKDLDTPGRLRPAHLAAGQHGRPDIGRRAGVGRPARSAGAGDRAGRQVLHRLGSTEIGRGSQRHDGGCLAGRREVSAENVVAGHRRRDVRPAVALGRAYPDCARQ